MFNTREQKLYTGTIIDMHSHILPNMDDGSQSLEQSISMLRIAAGEGTAVLIATPHLICDGSERKYIARSREKYENLCLIAHQLEIPVKIRLGFELLLSSSIQHAFDINDLLIDGTSKVLVELRIGSDPREDLEELLYALAHYHIGMILAHPERSRWLYDNKSYLNNLVNNGVMLQVNADSITGSWGKDVMRFTRKLTEQGVVHFIGSDAHSDTARSPHIRKALSILLDWIGEKETRKIAYQNTENLLQERQDI